MGFSTFHGLAAIRILIGLFFIVVGWEKVTGPYQNFLYVVQTYRLMPESWAIVEEMIARLMPWIEFLLGVFLFLGLWLKKVLYAFLGMIGGFLIVVAQAMIRKLPIDECGCFGEMFSMPLSGILALDSTLFLLVGIMLYHVPAASLWSLDRYFVTRDGDS